MTDDLAPSIREEKMGFALQTLTYPETFELSKLGHKGKERLEKAVAIVIDEDNRIKRCQFNRGYIHEHRETQGWITSATFVDPDELEASRIYADYRNSLTGSTTKDEVEDNG